MKLLYITRKFPPAVGGMEKYSYHLATELSAQTPTKVIAWGGSQKWLPFFLLKAFIQALWQVAAGRVTHIHMGDGVLAPLGVLLKTLTRRPVSITIMGLDMTYKNSLYQAVIPTCVKRLSSVICISRATMAECVSRGIPAAKCTFIPCGVETSEFKSDATRADLERIVGKPLAGRKVLLTVGRLVPRKGVRWFVDEVMPQLPPEYLYVVVGKGIERNNIAVAVARHNLHSRVLLLGQLSDNDVKTLYNTADIFVMPNVPVEGDMEGFGIVAIEAASAGLPVVASALEGIADAVVEGRTGVLCPPSDRGAIMNALDTALRLDRAKTRETVRTTYAWDVIGERCLRAIA